MTEQSASERYNGSCHCGSVRFEVKLSPPLYEQSITSCNCSICNRNGYLLVYPLESDVTWHSGLDTLTKYHFGAGKITHFFCPRCGTSICGKSNDPNFFADHWAINVRTLEGVEMETLNLKALNGKDVEL